jgi:hypothetical protein
MLSSFFLDLFKSFSFSLVIFKFIFECNAVLLVFEDSKWLSSSLIETGLFSVLN